MNNISARNKGLITGVIMIIISIAIYLAKKNFENNLQYITYAVYVAGILWTLLSFKNATGNTATFKQYFAESFKCFIVIALLMVVFTVVFLLLHPELKDQMVTLMTEELKKQKDIAPLDIDNKIAFAKKAFFPSLVMGAVFSYLAIGALVTLIASAFISAQKKSD